MICVLNLINTFWDPTRVAKSTSYHVTAGTAPAASRALTLQTLHIVETTYGPHVESAAII